MERRQGPIYCYYCCTLYLHLFFYYSPNRIDLLILVEAYRGGWLAVCTLFTTSMEDVYFVFIKLVNWRPYVKIPRSMYAFYSINGGRVFSIYNTVKL